MQPETSQPPKGIQRGCAHYRHPLYQGWSFGSAESVKSRLGIDGKVSTEEPTFHDTRPNVEEVHKALLTAENEACGTLDQQRFGCAGPWDEYFSIQNRRDTDPTDRFPSEDIFIDVAFGTSEGIYINIRHEPIGGRARTIILGKTCASNWDAWQKCHESLTRISWMLNQP